jgi:hypothetical protein
MCSQSRVCESLKLKIRSEKFFFKDDVRSCHVPDGSSQSFVLHVELERNRYPFHQTLYFIIGAKVKFLKFLDFNPKASE